MSIENKKENNSPGAKRDDYIQETVKQQSTLEVQMIKTCFKLQLTYYINKKQHRHEEILIDCCDGYRNDTIHHM